MSGSNDLSEVSWLWSLKECVFSATQLWQKTVSGNLYDFIDIYVTVQLQFVMTLGGNVEKMK